MCLLVSAIRGSPRSPPGRLLLGDKVVETEHHQRIGVSKDTLVDW